MKTSLIITVLNEESTIESLLDSIMTQTQLPDEVVIVDGGSKDSTLSRIKNHELRIKNNCELKIIGKKGNRAVGRNEAVRNAKHEIILCSDAGCILDDKWTEEITKPFSNINPSPQLSPKRRGSKKDKDIDVVSGYYKGLAKNVFQKCLMPYVLVMPDKIDSGNFLPASRSMALRKSAWKQVGGFDEALSHNEDYAFAKELKTSKLDIVFQEKAVVYWMPRETFNEAYIMFYRFAYGDIEAGIIRPKVVFIFVRYIIGISLVIYYLISPSYFILTTLYLPPACYLLWSIYKNYRYVKDIRAFYYLPLLQLTSDIAVITGSVMGIFYRARKLLH